MGETRKLAAILVSDVVGYSRLAGADEDRILARLRALRSDLIDPTIAVHHGRVVKRTGDGAIVEFRSVVDAVNCAIEVQRAMVERNAGVAPDKRIEFRIGIHLGDVVEESDGDLMGEGVNIAARLEGIAKPGGICLSEQAYWQVKGRLDLKVTDLGPVPLKNIAEPLRAYSLQVGVSAVAKIAEQGAATAPNKRFTKPLLVLAGVVVLIVLAVGAWRYLSASQFASVDHARSIVVVPLSNLSGDASQDYLVDALTDELTTSIARLPGMFVIARNTASSYRGKPIDLKAIGKELGVKYVLEGSVQPTENRIRVNAQLIDADTGAHLWAESFDEDRADLLQTEDAIVARLARTLDLKMNDVEAAKAIRSRPNNPDAEDLALQCVARIFDNYADSRDPVKHPELYEACEEALRLDPGNTRALKALAYRLSYLSSGPGRTADLARLDALVQKALSVEPNDLRARYAKGVLDVMHGRNDEALVEFQRVIASDGSDIGSYSWLGWIYMTTGEEEKAIAVFDEAMLLSPHDPDLPILLKNKALALGALGRDAEASALLTQALTLSPNDRESLGAQAAMLANLGREGEAREVYQRFVAAGGGQRTTVAGLKLYFADAAHVPVWGAYLERVFAGLRKLGMPEE